MQLHGCDSAINIEGYNKIVPVTSGYKVTVGDAISIGISTLTATPINTVLPGLRVDLSSINITANTEVKQNKNVLVYNNASDGNKIYGVIITGTNNVGIPVKISDLTTNKFVLAHETTSNVLLVVDETKNKVTKYTFSSTVSITSIVATDLVDTIDGANSTLIDVAYVSSSVIYYLINIDGIISIKASSSSTIIRSTQVIDCTECKIGLYTSGRNYTPLVYKRNGSLYTRTISDTDVLSNEIIVSDKEIGVYSVCVGRSSTLQNTTINYIDIMYIEIDNLNGNKLMLKTFTYLSNVITFGNSYELEDDSTVYEINGIGNIQNKICIVCFDIDGLNYKIVTTYDPNKIFEYYTIVYTEFAGATKTSVDQGCVVVAEINSILTSLLSVTNSLVPNAVALESKNSLESVLCRVFT